ncbi:MAG: hypothetical protein GXN91_05060 [Epsilonproteobacteria bacterium]|nr:hypothetical protein [Campylobacterota bacterium]
MRGKEILKERLYESLLHKKRLSYARDVLKFIMPLTIEKYKELDDIFISIIDQMLFRFSKLQDTLGEKVFALILELEGEQVKKMSFIDRLNRLEELEIVDRLEWMNLRINRNEIAHEYSYNEEDIIENINFIYERSQKLIEIFEKIYSYCNKKFKIEIELKGANG